MQDLAIQTLENGTYDLVVNNFIMQDTDNLKTLILLLLFTDGRANINQKQIPFQRSGWIGNLFPDFDTRLIGSDLWIYTDQTVLSDSVLPYIRNSVQTQMNRIVETGMAKGVTIDVQKESSETVSVEIIFDVIESQIENKYFKFWLKTGD